MATVALSTSSVTLDPGTAYELTVLNSGAVACHVQIAGGLGYDERLRPGQQTVVHPNGQAVTAYVRSDTGQVTTTTSTNPETASSGGGSFLTTSAASATYVQATMAPAPSPLGGGVDVAALQALADAINTAGGGDLVLLPNSTYQLNNSLFLGSKTRLRGSGWSSVLKMTAAFGAVYNKGWVDGVGNTDVSVQDLTIDGNSLGTMGVVLAGVQRGNVHNVRMKDVTHYGVWLWSSGESATTHTQGLVTQQVTVSDCHISGVVDVGIEMSAAQACSVVGNTVECLSGLAGIYAWNGATDCTISGNTVTGTGATPPVVGFRVGGLADTTYPQATARIIFTGNTATNVLAGLRARGTSGNVISDVLFTGNSIQSWALTGAQGGFGVDLDYVARVKITENHIEGATRALAVSDTAVTGTFGSCSAVSFDGNRVYNCGTSNLYGLASGSLSGNTFVSTTNTPVNFSGCTNLVINNNRGIDCCNSTSGGQSMFSLSDSNSVACSGNTIVGNKTTDSRGTKFMKGVAVLNGGADYNVCVGNNSRGAAGSARAVVNAGTGTHNLIQANINDGAPTVAVGAQSASTAIDTAGANDTAMSITATTVASPAAGALFTVTFTGSAGMTPKSISVTPRSSATASCQPYVSAKSATAFTVSCATAPAGGTALLFDVAVAS